MNRTGIAVACFLFVAAPAFAAGQDANQDSRDGLNQALQTYRRALASNDAAERQQMMDQAFVQFNQVFEANPSSDVVLAFIQRAGEDVIASMMNSPEDRFQDIGRRLFGLAQPGQALRRDRETIQGYVRDLEARETEVWQLAFWHLKNIGPYAVRDLVPLLGSTNNDTLRARVIMVLTEMRWDATLALVAATKSTNVTLRQNALITLGHIRDERALPYLKAIVENANEPPEIVRYAHEAISRTTRLHPTQWGTSEEWFLRLAEKYYYSHPDVVHDWQANDLIWSWDKEQDRLVEREIPRFAFNEQAAEEVLYDWLDVNPNHAGAWGLLAAVHFAERIEANIALDAARSAVDTGDATQEDVDKIRQLLADVDRANVLGAATGRPYVYLALDRSLHDGRAEVGVECLEALSRMGTADDLPNMAPQAEPMAFGTPLAEALTAEDKRVRYWAAFAWLRLNPQMRKIGMELVMPNVIDALGEQGVRVALIAHPARNQDDWNVINGLKRTLEGVGGFPTVATDVSEAMLRARSFPTEDIIFMDFSMATSVVFQEDITRARVTESLYQSVRADVRTRAVKIAIVCHSDEEMGQAQQIFQSMPADAYVMPSVSRVEMRQLFGQLWSNDTELMDAKLYADDIARRAAEALAGLDVDNTYFPYLSAVEALMATAAPNSGRPDAVRVPALRALGRFADVRSMEVLAAVLADRADDAGQRDQQKAVRTAAAEALADLFARAQASPSDGVFQAMKAALMDGDADIELAIGRAFGGARLTGEQRRELETFRRIRRPENP